MYLKKTSKSPYYQLVYYKNGKKTTVSTKTSDLKKAQEFLENFVPNKVQSPPKITSDRITLTKFRKEYEEFISSTKSAHYISSVNLSFNQFESFTGEIYLDEINVRIVERFISSVYKRAKHSAHLYYRTLKAAFTKAENWEYIYTNPFKKIKPAKLPKKIPLFINKSELQLIINNTDEQFLKDLFQLAFYTGMRLGEIVNLRWNWIDLRRNIITVKNSADFTTKSKKERIIPIAPAIRSIIKKKYYEFSSLDGSQFVFTRTKGIKLNEDYVSKKFKNAVRSAELNDSIHFHTLRHSFASMLVQKGVSLYIVKELLGHESITTTQIYSHLRQESLENAVSLL